MNFFDYSNTAVNAMALGKAILGALDTPFVDGLHLYFSKTMDQESKIIHKKDPGGRLNMIARGRCSSSMISAIDEAVEKFREKYPSEVSMIDLVAIGQRIVGKGWDAQNLVCIADTIRAELDFPIQDDEVRRLVGGHPRFVLLKDDKWVLLPAGCERAEP